jgi:hypothetical protein
MFAQRVAEATPNDNTGIFFEQGNYPLVQLDQFKFFQSTKPGREGVEMVALVFDIIQSNVPSRPAGTRGVSQILNSLHAPSADDCKRFINALFPSVASAQAWFGKLVGRPLTDDELASVLSIEGMSSVGQPVRGRLLKLECFTKVSQKTGKEFTKHWWYPVADETQAKAAELRIAAGIGTHEEIPF